MRPRSELIGSMGEQPVEGRIAIAETDLAYALAEVPGNLYLPGCLLVAAASAGIWMQLHDGPWMWIAWVCAALVCVFRWAQTAGRKRYIGRFLAKYDGETETVFAFSEPGLEIHTASVARALPWSSVRGYHEGRSSFLVFTGPNTFVIIPKRAFLDEHREAVRKLLRQHSRRCAYRLLHLSAAISATAVLAAIVFNALAPAE